jgi:hypothetical protein
MCSKWPPRLRTDNSAILEKETRKHSKIPEVFCISLSNCWIRRHTSSLDYTGKEFYFHISTRHKIKKILSQVSTEARKQKLHICDQSGAQDRFRAVSDTLHGCNAVERRRVESKCQDAYWTTHLLEGSVECVWRKLRQSWILTRAGKIWEPMM